MPGKAYVSRQAFNAGEVAPLVDFRDDVQKYASACLTCENAVPLVEGAAKKMPGTYFAGRAGSGATFIGFMSGSVLTITEVLSGTIRIGETVTGPGIYPGTVITGYIPTVTPLTTYYTVSAFNGSSNGIGDWQHIGIQYRTHFEPVTTALTDLQFTNYGFSIPSTAVILGITATFDIVSQFPTTSVVSEVALWKSGAQFGTEKTPGTPFNTSIQHVPYGGSTDTWGAAPLYSDINDSTFGPAIAVATDTSRVFIFDSVQITVDYSITTMVTSGSPGGVGTYTISRSQSVASEIMQTESEGKSRLVPFQFSTAQGAVLELSAGVIRIWEGATEGSWSLGLALTTPPGLDYNPATAYIAGNIVLVGPWAAALNYVPIGAAPAFWLPNPLLGVLTLAAPYGSNYSSAVPVTFTTNSVDTLAVTVLGTSPNQGINIALANATPANNSATAIQTALRALGTLNSPGNNYVSLTAWTVTPDPIYAATPWIIAPTLPPPAQINVGSTVSFVAQAVAANTGDHFPVKYDGTFDATYWAIGNATPQGPLELTTPYLEQDLFALDCSTQSADVLWIFHPDYPPAVVERLGPNLWSYSPSLPGQLPGSPPYRGTLAAVKTGYSALGQSITAITKANPCVVTVAGTSQVFADGSRIYMNLISGMVELNQGEFLVSGGTSNADGTFSFSLIDPDTSAPVDSTGFLTYVSGGFAVQVVAMFASEGNYPACGTLYQQRLCVGGTDANPTRMYGSVEADYPDFITDPNADDFGIQFTLVSNQVNRLLNMIGTPNSLLIGTSGGVWVMDASTGSSLSQTNVNAALQTSIGVSALQPQLVNGSAIFVSRSSRIVTFLVFSFASNQWESNDLTRLNRTITLGADQASSGIAQTAFQVEPYPIFWAVRNDGQLVGLVFNTQDQVYAWFRVDMTAQGGFIESAAVISGANQEDQLVVVVRRTVNGLTARYVEYFMPQELFSQLSNAFFVHCGLQWNGGPGASITGISQADPTVVTAPGHGFSNGMNVQIKGVDGMTFTVSAGPPPIVNSINQDSTEAYTVQNATADTFELAGMDTSAYTAYVSGGTVKQVKNQVTGMSYLIGNTVVAVGDGAVVLQSTVVTSDTVGFPFYANLITIGIPYQYTLQPTNPVLSSPAATTRGQPQKLNRITLSLYESMGGNYGTDLDHMYPITYGAGTVSQLPPQMFTGEVTRDMDADWTERDEFYITQSEPLPFSVRGLVFRLSANQD